MRNFCTVGTVGPGVSRQVRVSGHSLCSMFRQRKSFTRVGGTVAGRRDCGGSDASPVHAGLC